LKRGVSRRRAKACQERHRSPVKRVRGAKVCQERHTSQGKRVRGHPRGAKSVTMRRWFGHGASRVTSPAPPRAPSLLRLRLRLRGR
jgi:hypothetical protein